MSGQGNGAEQSADFPIGQNYDGTESLSMAHNPNVGGSVGTSRIGYGVVSSSTGIENTPFPVAGTSDMMAGRGGGAFTGGWDPATGTYKQAGVHGPNPSMLPGYTAPGIGFSAGSARTGYGATGAQAPGDLPQP
ncbi:hypothetical protein WJX84_004320 [Apatococcus fuscideae]|uniref:Uncharacterized protein n=1 Tax=Apatococcus fuscideae TaxID=2026836 RepID=A0AAW1STG9_9CHLO